MKQRVEWVVNVESMVISMIFERISGVFQTLNGLLDPVEGSSITLGPHSIQILQNKEVSSHIYKLRNTWNRHILNHTYNVMWYATQWILLTHIHTHPFLFNSNNNNNECVVNNSKYHSSRKYNTQGTGIKYYHTTYIPGYYTNSNKWYKLSHTYAYKVIHERTGMYFRSLKI